MQKVSGDQNSLDIDFEEESILKTSKPHIIKIRSLPGLELALIRQKMINLLKRTITVVAV